MLSDERRRTRFVPMTPPATDLGLVELLEARDAQACASWLEETRGLEAVRVISRLSEEQRTALLQLLLPEAAAEVIEALPEPQAIDALEGLEPETAARIIEELPSDEQADLIGELQKSEAEAILEQLQPDEAESVRRLAAYEDDEAGGLMITEFLSYPESAQVAEVLRDLDANVEEYAHYDVQYAYVTGDDGLLLGVLALRDLLLAPRGRVLEEMLVPIGACLLDHDPISKVVEAFRETHFAGLPVVDATGALVGVVEREALEHALAEESDQTYRASQGIIGGEELRSMPLVLRARRRLTWLSANVLLNVLAACVIAAHQETLEAVIALAVFLPIISDMSGCSGNQAVAVSMREMTLGVARPGDFLNVWRKELSVGLINGIALGLLVGCVAWIWKGNPYLGLVVGGALAVNTLVAVSIGGVVPLTLKKLGMDPALASGPVLTTLTDMCGFLLVLGSASMLLDQLV
jgi:magnesium transporter